MVVTCQEMRTLEETAFASGVDAADLMEQAGRGIAGVIRQFHPKPGTLGLYLGKGNNAGDALVAARHLMQDGWQVWAHLAFSQEEFKPLPIMHWSSLSGRVQWIDQTNGEQNSGLPLVLLDGLVGIGAEGPLNDPLSALACEMNDLRRRKHAQVIAMDIPSGMNGDTGETHGACVEADITATVGYVKRGLLADAATNKVGRLVVISLPALIATSGDSAAKVPTAQCLAPFLPRRSFDFHKGMAGRVGVIAGSKGFIGAATLSTLGALRGGAGLVTLFVKKEAYPMIAAQAPAEVMVKVVDDYRDVLQIPHDALAIGPGLGFDWAEEVMELIQHSEAPTVIDADALTLISRAKDDILTQVRYPRLLTPHPGEMSRLIARHPAWAGMDRRSLADSFANAYPSCVLLLKGARTVIASKGHPISFNTTGSPAMASGGMGDVLTGLCAALMAQGASAFDSACIGAWTSGRAAEIALTSGQSSEESLLATDVAANLGAAFTALKQSSY